MNKLKTALVSAAALVLPATGATAATSKPARTVKVTTKTYPGSVQQADEWGSLQVMAVVRTTTTTVGTKKTVKRKLTKVTVPTYPNHTGRSQYINQTALPWLIQEALQAQSPNIRIISGATYSSEAFAYSLQSALQHASFKV